jgi:hypothetical protein
MDRFQNSPWRAPPRHRRQVALFADTVSRSTRRQLTDDGNIEITGRDLREKVPVVGQHDLFDGAGPHGLDPTLRTA